MKPPPKELDGFDFSAFPISHIEQALQCFDNFLKWAKQKNLKVMGSEISLVSEKHQFGGTLDSVPTIDGKLSLVDVKTGKAIYGSHILQQVAYEALWNENFPDNPITGGYNIIRTGKEIAMFSHSWYASGSFPMAWTAFLNCRELYEIAKELKKLK